MFCLPYLILTFHIPGFYPSACCYPCECARHALKGILPTSPLSTTGTSSPYKALPRVVCSACSFYFCCRECTTAYMFISYLPCPAESLTSYRAPGMNMSLRPLFSKGRCKSAFLKNCLLTIKQVSLLNF